ncbi:glutamate-1-semialdehyde 2,1-aminomutase [Desulfogranum marinum]|jgi:glutamate-1-semialdehyde 2,1-aminomutase|uniref:glutamate-1-semialdehyde 2,1-aminomutase n=1 Tax=Desulfogranum marinum TaxID=453220 RepID=UPI001963C58C|nr:glutamate-1-semialdehyde 2,1-aminomutase [Desulfogranum marinum]MBM9511750.1 glutamate-1-semialdehyde 2,1-aminomutase [Desulfogranum marinum]
MITNRSVSLFSKAQAVIPGGVNSPVRACRSVGCDPLFIQKASGCIVTDVDGNEFIDFVSSWGPMIAGHAQPEVVDAIQQAAVNGTSFGAPTSVEVELAELVCECVPSIEKVRFVNSGTEATMSAVRLARGYTGKNMVVKFDGCYHGHSDSFLVKAGSGLITLGIPGSPGVPDDIVKNTLSIPYNDKEVLERTLRDENLDIACVIVEPVAGNMGVVVPDMSFVKKLRELTTELGIVLIFDEVITGFRLSLGGAQERFGITPDLTCLGKIIGGGLPVGAYGGKAEIMDNIAPDGPVYQAGTLSGNPLAMSAGLAMLQLVRKPDFYKDLEQKSDWFAAELQQIADAAAVPTVLNRIGSMMTCFFTDEPVTDFESAMKANTEMYGKHYRNMLEGGMWLAPSQFEATFISAAHDRIHLEKALNMIESSFKKLMN